MKKKYGGYWILIWVVILFCIDPSTVIARNTVVVIPLGKGNSVPVVETGQKRCTHLEGSVWVWDDNCTEVNRPPGQDGELTPGVPLPTPRFIDNHNGTVTDNLTGLIWLQDANCALQVSWSNALVFASDMYDGWTGDGNGGDCDLSDGSQAGDWRLPTVNELVSLVDHEYFDPALSNAAGNGQWTSDEDAFSRVGPNYYWSSTTYTYKPKYAWRVGINAGGIDFEKKSEGSCYVWPVRGGK